MWRSPGGEERYLANNLQLSYPGGWASLVVRLGLGGTLEVYWQVGGLLIAGKCFQGWADPCRGGWGGQGGGGCVSNRSWEQWNVFHRLQWKTDDPKEKRGKVGFWGQTPFQALLCHRYHGACGTELLSGYFDDFNQVSLLYTKNI